MDGLEERHRKNWKCPLGYRGLVSKTVRFSKFWSDSQNCKDSVVVPWLSALNLWLAAGWEVVVAD